MKYIVIIGDGMADRPIQKLKGKTPLQAANKPNMDWIAAHGRSGLLRTIPDNLGAGSDVANMTIMGYDPKKYYTGRGPLEAASIGVKLAKGEVAFRCNLITEENGEIVDYSADHITTNEARELIAAVREAFSEYGSFHAGVSYRHIFVSKGGEDLECTPPHDAMGGKISERLIKPSTYPMARMLNELMLSSKNLLAEHPVNAKRMRNGKRPANMIWLWGQGKTPELETFEKKYGLKGAIISAVDLLRGIGTYTGMEALKVPGATGYYDTNYAGKAEWALRALDRFDYIYVHVEAPDEASHAGDLDMKIKAIEDLDEKLVGRILDGAGDAKVAILPDHATPIEVRTHVRDPVPFSIYSPTEKGDGTKGFDEESAAKGSYGQRQGTAFMELLLGGAKARPA